MENRQKGPPESKTVVEAIQSLRAVHLLFAILWAGGAVYRSHVVERVLADDDAAARFFATAPHGPFMGMTSVGTIVFGGALMGLNSEAYSLEAIGRGAWILGAGMGFAVMAFAIGVFGHIPTDRRLRPLAAARVAGHAHDTGTYTLLVAREKRLGQVSLALIGLAMLTMLLFRF